MKNGYIEALDAGQEVVIIDNNTKCNSSIFWKSNGTYHTFTRSFGIIDRPGYTDKDFLDHIKRVSQDGAQFFIRGYREV